MRLGETSPLVMVPSPESSPPASYGRSKGCPVSVLVTGGSELTSGPSRQPLGCIALGARSYFLGLVFSF
jgi:hypothetical protein